MRLKQFLAAGSFALAAFAALPAAAQNCVDFIDVSATNAACPSVEWLKNRSITTGCEVPNSYCPNAAVSRLAMALFMTRLGDKLTPTFLRKRLFPHGTLDFSIQPIHYVCPTDAVAINGYPRTALVRGLVNVYTPNGGMDIEAWVVYSTDGGTVWTTPATSDGFAYGVLYSGETPPNDISLHPMNAIDLNVGSSYRFALAARRTSGVGDRTNVYCENLVQLINRNGSSTPFDAAASSGPHGRGD